MVAECAEVFAAKMLELIETKLDIDIRNTFDLIVGTSTGGIIAAAITIEYGLTQLVDDYVKNAPKIFRWRLNLHCRSKYDRTPLENFLHDRLGDVKLGRNRKATYFECHKC